MYKNEVQRAPIRHVPRSTNDSGISTASNKLSLIGRPVFSSVGPLTTRWGDALASTSLSMLSTKFTVWCWWGGGVVGWLSLIKILYKNL